MIFFVECYSLIVINSEYLLSVDIVRLVAASYLSNQNISIFALFLFEP